MIAVLDRLCKPTPQALLLAAISISGPIGDESPSSASLELERKICEPVGPRKCTDGLDLKPGHEGKPSKIVSRTVVSRLGEFWPDTGEHFVHFVRALSVVYGSSHDVLVPISRA
jgi:hypothetical protein